MSLFEVGDVWNFPEGDHEVTYTVVEINIDGITLAWHGGEYGTFQLETAYSWIRGGMRPVL